MVLLILSHMHPCNMSLTPFFLRMFHVCATDSTCKLGVGYHLLIYWLRKATIVLKSFSYLSGCALTVATAVDNLSHLIPFNRYLTFDLGSSPWHPYSIRFTRIIWYLTCQVHTFPNFMLSFLHHRLISVMPSQLMMLLH